MGLFDGIKVKKSTIGISITPKSLLEIAEFDYETRKVLKYTNIEIDYNLSTRQISDLETFEYSLRQAFTELGINLNSNVYLSLPTTLIGHQTLPNILDDDSIKMALASEAEKNYIFKKYEPLISHYEVSNNPENETKFLAYSAFQKEVLNEVKGVLEKIGLKILAIDTSYTSMIRGLCASGEVSESLLEGANWNVLSINSNSFAIFSMIGDKLFEVFEDPLAIKSFNEDEIYPAITAASSSNLMNYPADHLIIVSSSDDVSAEILSNYLNVGCSKSFIENNKYSKSPFIECDYNVLPSKAPEVSPEIVGISAWDKYEQGVKFNFASDGGIKEYMNPTISLGGRELELTAQLVQNILLGYIAACLLIVGALWYVSESLSGAQNKQLQKLSSQLNELERFVKDSNVQKFDMSDQVKKIHNNNKQIIKSYDSISIDIPEKLWLEEMEIYKDLSVYIKGKAYKMNDILSYFESLQKLSKFKDLKISSLKVIEDGAFSKDEEAQGLSLVSEKTYAFEFGKSRVTQDSEEESIKN